MIKRLHPTRQRSVSRQFLDYHLIMAKTGLVLLFQRSQIFLLMNKTPQEYFLISPTCGQKHSIRNPYTRKDQVIKMNVRILITITPNNSTFKSWITISFFKFCKERNGVWKHFNWTKVPTEHDTIGVFSNSVNLRAKVFK